MEHQFGVMKPLFPNKPEKHRIDKYELEEDRITLIIMRLSSTPRLAEGNIRHQISQSRGL